MCVNTCTLNPVGNEENKCIRRLNIPFFLGGGKGVTKCNQSTYYIEWLPRAAARAPGAISEGGGAAAGAAPPGGGEGTSSPSASLDILPS